jgi:hypothetical protein
MQRRPRTLFFRKQFASTLIQRERGVDVETEKWDHKVDRNDDEHHDDDNSDTSSSPSQIARGEGNVLAGRVHKTELWPAATRSTMRSRAAKYDIPKDRIRTQKKKERKDIV